MPDRLDVMVNDYNFSPRRFRQEDGKFKASLGYKMRLSMKSKQNEIKTV